MASDARVRAPGGRPGIGLAATALLFLAGVAVANETRIVESPSAWMPAGRLTLPAAPDGVNDASAGCVVVLHHILPDGRSAGARVLQGGFTRDVTQAAQLAFYDAAMDSTNGWRFKAKRKAPAKEHRTVVVGFTAATSPEASRHVEGIDLQDARVRSACVLEDLGDWGKRNAVLVDEALARNDTRILVPAKDQPVLLWVADGALAPPRYPMGYVKQNIVGCVVVGFVIGADGIPGQFRVMESRTSPPLSARDRQAFEGSALMAVSKWRFAPGPNNLERFQEFRQSTIKFMLGSSAPACDEVDLTKGVARPP
jgi:hypothetical protein